MKKVKEIQNTHMYGWKTIQFFVSLQGVNEVQVSHDKDLRCTCEGFKGRKKCKHVNYCKTLIRNNVFPIEVHESAPIDMITAATKSPEAFRTLLMRYGKVISL